MAVQTFTALKPLFSVHPGEWYFGAEYERLHTVLGSCVALVTWHPKLKIGGICHYLLSVAPVAKRGYQGDCRYADNALAQMKKSMLGYATLKEYQISIFGGGDMFSHSWQHSIGADNITCVREWVSHENLHLHKTDVGGSISRSIILVVPTGEIQLKRYAMNPQQRL